MLIAGLLWGVGPGAASVLGQPSNDVTFFVGSDPHYGFRGTGVPLSAVISRGAIERMNALPGGAYPAEVGGGVVDTPRGVLLIGDLTAASVVPEWTAFTNDWGLNGERLLRFPVYEGFGNHDLGSDVVPSGIRARNPLRSSVCNISTNGYHYSWDWGFLHLVCLNLFPGNELDLQGHDPRSSLSFLRDDLASRVGTSGRPVVLYHHYAFDVLSTQFWWSDQQRTNYLQAITNYNVIAILAGHTHDVVFTPWYGRATYEVGTLGLYAGDFLVAHVTKTNLAILQRRADNTWGDVFTRAITFPEPPIIVQSPQSTAVLEGSDYTLTVVATAPALAYQWRFNGTNMPSAVGSALTLTNVQLAQVGTYTVLVTNNHGSALSSNAVLTMLSPPGPITGLTTFILPQDRSLNLSATGGAGQSYLLLRASNLSSPVIWSPIQTNQADANGRFQFTDPGVAIHPQRFYRFAR